MLGASVEDRLQPSSEIKPASRSMTTVPTQTPEDEEKVEEYLNVIQERVLSPIQSEDVQRSCTATLLLLFAAIDGLGKLLDPTGIAGPHDRIIGFLNYMGGGYAAHAEDLDALRNSLVHNAINVESVLSHAKLDRDSHRHLTRLGADDLLYVNTAIMCKDFLRVFDQFRTQLQDDPALRMRAAKQLVWVEIDDPLEIGGNNHPDQMGNPSATPPPPIRFIRTR
jgi:hypothetical protein